MFGLCPVCRVPFRANRIFSVSGEWSGQGLGYLLAIDALDAFACGGTVSEMTRAAALLTDTVRAELGDALERNGAQLGLAYLAWQEGAKTPTEMFEAGVGANSGASGNLIIQVKSLLEGHIPTAPSRAVQSLRAARALLKQNRGRLSTGTVAFLEALIAELDDAASDGRALAEEERALARTTVELDRLSASAGGVYVYTLPHYWRYPTDEHRGLYLLKVGATSGDPESRIKEQARATAVPEDPIILRFYPAPSERDPFDLERKFHKLLDAAGHPRSRANAAGREWFSTSLEFLDTVADILGLTVEGNYGD